MFVREVIFKLHWDLRVCKYEFEGVSHWLWIENICWIWARNIFIDLLIFYVKDAAQVTGLHTSFISHLLLSSSFSPPIASSGFCFLFSLFKLKFFISRFLIRILCCDLSDEQGCRRHLEAAKPKWPHLPLDRLSQTFFCHCSGFS